MSSRAWNGAAMTHKEIAAEIGMHPTTVCTLEKRAIKKVKEYLQNKFGNHVTIEDLLPYYKEEIIEHEMPKL